MKEVATPWVVWLVGQFHEVIHGIQSFRRSDLILYDKAGILWSIRNAEGYTPLLYFINKLATDTTYTKQQFEKNLNALSYISKKKIESGFRESTKQLLKEGNFKLLITLFTHFDSFKQFFPDDYDSMHLRDLFTRMMRGVCQYQPKQDADTKQRQECLNVLLAWESQHRFSWGTTEIHKAFNELQNYRFGDIEMAIVLSALYKRGLELKEIGCLKPLTFTAFTLADYSLRYSTSLALSSWDSHQHLTVLDLSNNPSLGSAEMFYTWIYSSGLQHLAKSLEKNSTLQKLILAECGVNDRDFSSLVWMLKLNSALKVLDLSRNKDITEKTVLAKLPSLNQHRHQYRDKHSFLALRPRLDVIINKKKRSENNRALIDTTQPVFHQNIRAYIEQLRLHSLGVQIKTKHAPADHGSAWDQVAHFFHVMVLVSSAAGVALGVAEIIETMKLTVGTFKHGLHKAEDTIKLFEHLSLGPIGLKIVVDIIFAIINGIVSDEFYYRWEQHGLSHTMVRTLVDFVQSVYELIVSGHHHDITEFFEKFNSLAIALDIDKTAAELSHHFKNSEDILGDPYEVEFLSDAVAQYFKQFCNDPQVTIDWSCVAQNFSHWLLSTKPQCSNVVNLKEKTASNDKGKEEESNLTQTVHNEERSEWVEDMIRRRGFRCLGNNNEVITFNVSYKKTSADNKPEEWITTDGDRFGYYPVGKKFLQEIQERIKGYKKENPETRLIRIVGVGIEYEISDNDMARLSQHTLTAILSGYRPTEEQLRSLETAVNVLRGKVEALEVKTSEHTAAIATLKLRVDQHDTKHQEVDGRLQMLGRGEQQRDQPAAEFNQEAGQGAQSIARAKARIEALEVENDIQTRRIGALEGEVGDLKKQSVKDQKEIAGLKEDVVNLKGTVAALLTQQRQVNAVANNAALDADNAAHRAERQEPPERVQPRGNINNQHEIAEDNVAVHENPPGDLGDAQEEDPPNPLVHTDPNPVLDDHTPSTIRVDPMK